MSNGILCLTSWNHSAKPTSTTLLQPLHLAVVRKENIILALVLMYLLWAPSKPTNSLHCLAHVLIPPEENLWFSKKNINWTDSLYVRSPGVFRGPSSPPKNSHQAEVLNEINWISTTFNDNWTLDIFVWWVFFLVASLASQMNLLDFYE